MDSVCTLTVPRAGKSLFRTINSQSVCKQDIISNNRPKNVVVSSSFEVELNTSSSFGNRNTVGPVSSHLRSSVDNSRGRFTSLEDDMSCVSSSREVHSIDNSLSTHDADRCCGGRSS